MRNILHIFAVALGICLTAPAFAQQQRVVDGLYMNQYGAILELDGPSLFFTGNWGGQAQSRKRFSFVVTGNSFKMGNQTCRMRPDSFVCQGKADQNNRYYVLIEPKSPIRKNHEQGAGDGFSNARSMAIKKADERAQKAIEVVERLQKDIALEKKRSANCVCRNEDKIKKLDAAIVEATTKMQQAIRDVATAHLHLEDGLYMSQFGHSLELSGRFLYFTGNWNGEPVTKKKLPLIVEGDRLQYGSQSCRMDRNALTCIGFHDGEIRNYSPVPQNQRAIDGLYVNQHGFTLELDGHSLFFTGNWNGRTVVRQKFPFAVRGDSFQHGLQTCRMSADALVCIRETDGRVWNYKLAKSSMPGLRAEYDAARNMAIAKAEAIARAAQEEAESARRDAETARRRADEITARMANIAKLSQAEAGKAREEARRALEAADKANQHADALAKKIDQYSTRSALIAAENASLREYLSGVESIADALIGP